MDSGSSPLRASHRTLRELVHDRLLEDIVTARLRPGQTLSDKELAEKYEVSRGPVREALRSLEGLGLVSVTAFKGAVVTSLSKAEVSEIYQMRIELEGLATRLAVEHITPQDLEDLQRNIELMEAAIDDPHEWQLLTNAFHARIYQAASSPRLSATIEDLTRLTLSYSYLYLRGPGRTSHAHPDHHIILAAIKSRDAELAERITREHLKMSSQVIVDFVEEG